MPREIMAESGRKMGKSWGQRPGGGQLPYHTNGARSSQRDGSSAGTREDGDKRRSGGGSYNGDHAMAVGGSDGAPVDMDSLKAALAAAMPGTGQVEKLVKTSRIRLRARGFTTLIQMCGKAKAADKALEVFEVMKTQPDVAANCITYSALISACGSCGRWSQALQIFEDMKEAAKVDSGCQPNTITYSALISACQRGGRHDKAMEVYGLMREAGVEADMITYSSLISGCEKSGLYDEALEVLDTVQRAGMQATVSNYNNMILHLGQTGQSEKAVEMFLSMQMAGLEPDKMTYSALMSGFESSRSAIRALQLIEAMQAHTIPVDAELATSALQAAAGKPKLAKQLFATIQRAGTRLTEGMAQALTTAMGGDRTAASELLNNSYAKQ